MLLLMGLFATYMGFIYNEFFAVPLELFGSCYATEPTTDVSNRTVYPITPADRARFPTSYYNRTDYDCVYTLGMDPRWF